MILVAFLFQIPNAACGVPSHIAPSWTSSPVYTPSNGSPDGPVMGNGAVGVAVGSSGAGALSFFIDRNDVWTPATGDISACGYDIDNAGRRTVGALEFKFAGDNGFSARQIIHNGTVTTSQPVKSGGTLRTSSFVVRGVDALVTDIWWELYNESSVGPLLVTAVAAQGSKTTRDFCHHFDQGSVQGLTWASRQVGWPYQNQARNSIGRRHFYKAAWATSATMAGAPTTHSHAADNVPENGDVICTDFDGQCALCNNSTDTRRGYADYFAITITAYSPFYLGMLPIYYLSFVCWCCCFF
jgi:hypothetical protein